MTDKILNELVKINGAICSYPRLFKAEQYVSSGKPSGKPRFSCTFLVEPGSESFKAVNDAILAAARATWKDKGEAKLKGFRGNSNKYCFIDGDTKDDEHSAGKWVLTAHRNEDQGRPGVYDRDTSPLSEGDGKPYAGCFVNARVEIWAQDGENAGIRCKLVSVQFVRDGQAFGGGRKPKAEDYEAIPEEELA